MGADGKSSADFLHEMLSSVMAGDKFDVHTGSLSIGGVILDAHIRKRNSFRAPLEAHAVPSQCACFRRRRGAERIARVRGRPAFSTRNRGLRGGSVPTRSI